MSVTALTSLTSVGTPALVEIADPPVGCWACGSSTVIAGPDEFGNYDPCPLCQDRPGPVRLMAADMAWGTTDRSDIPADLDIPAVATTSDNDDDLPFS